MLHELEKYNRARLKIESCFNGLPHAPASLIKSLINMADPVTGLVVDISWWDLCKLMEVDKRPGRKNAGTPTKEVVREYINTIINQCGNYFKIATVGQKLQFKFINMPSIYAYYFANHKEQHIDDQCLSLSPSPYIETGSNEDFNTSSLPETPTEGHIDIPIAINTVKNINILTNKQNLTNKLTVVGVNQSLNTKQPIQPNFYPNQETITKALSRGFMEVTSDEEIQKFIQYNLNNKCQWVDFNPVFLNWLERNNEFRKTKKQPSNNTRRNNNECSSPKINSYEAAMAAVLNSNPNACAPTEHLKTQQTININADVDNSEAYRMALDSDDEHLRSTLHNETWDERQRCLG